MTLKVNGKEINVEISAEKATVAYLLDYLNIKSKVVVEKNKIILDGQLHDVEELSDGDVLEIVQFVGGG